MSTWIGKAGATVLTIFALAACGGGGGGGGSGNITPDGPGGPSKVFLADSANALVFSAANVNPPAGVLSVSRTISGTGVSNLMANIAYDAPPNDRLFVANSSSITVINNASVANGNVTPAKTVTSSFSNVGALYRDTLNDRLYVIDGLAGIFVFDNFSAATTATLPNRTISINRGGVTIVPDAIYVDTTRDILYAKIHVGGGGGVAQAIAVFDHASTISGLLPSDRELKFAVTVLGIVGDANTDRLFAVDSNNFTVMVFDGASTKDGFVPPSRTINTPTFLQRIALVPSTNRLYGVAADTRTMYIINNASTANGNVPVTSVTNPSFGSLTGLAVAP